MTISHLSLSLQPTDLRASWCTSIPARESSAGSAFTSGRWLHCLAGPVSQLT